jgi:hypothetical protein
MRKLIGRTSRTLTSHYPGSNLFPFICRVPRRATKMMALTRSILSIKLSFTKATKTKLFNGL